MNKKEQKRTLTELNLASYFFGIADEATVLDATTFENLW
jgi:hypothetical protein